MTAKFAQYITETDEGYNLEIPVNEEFAGVLVETVSMYIAKSNEWADEDTDEEWYPDGDLAVNWDIEGLSNNENAQTMGTLLLRNLHSDDDVTRVMGEFYWEHGFDTRLREILTAAGFSAEAAEDVSGSEWGMQDEGRASYDAYALAKEVRAAFAVA
jgi:hypothetical protein